MIRGRIIGAIFLVGFAVPTARAAYPQQAESVNPPPYRGVTTRVAGVFVTPLANVLMTGSVQVESTQALPDGSTEVKKATARIARDSRGRIYNERRSFATPGTS